MQVAAFTGFGGPDDVEVQERPDPSAGPSEAVLTVEASALNHHDLWILEGESSVDEADLPFVAGVDVAGTVESVGAGVDSVADGDRVVLCPNLTCGSCRYCRDGPENRCAEYGLFHGGFAERALVRADRLVPIPDGVDVATAAAVPVAYMTAWHMLRRGDATPGDRVFIPGATGGVGVAAVQLAGAMGAETIGTSSSAAKLDRLDDLGVDETIQATSADELASAMADRDPVDVVVNHLGGPFTQVGLDALRRDGRMVVCGRTAGQASEVDVRELYWEHKQLLGSTMGTQPDLERVLGFVADGAFKPPIAGEYPLTETGDAFETMQQRDLFGKLVVRP